MLPLRSARINSMRVKSLTKLFSRHRSLRNWNDNDYKIEGMPRIDGLPSYGATDQHCCKGRLGLTPTMLFVFAL